MPKLDGTESIYQISGTTTHTGGEMGGGSGYLLTSFDNSGDWELTAQAKFSGQNCCIGVFKDGATAREQNEMGITAYKTTSFWYTNGTYSDLYSDGRHLSANTYYTTTIKKQNGTITTTINGVTRTLSWSSGTSPLHIGVGGWGTTGNVCTIKDIVVKPL